MISWLIIAIVTTAAWGGLVFHSSHGDDLILGRYTTSHALLLLVATVAWVSINIQAYKRRQALGAVLISIGIALLLAMVIPSGARPLVDQILDTVCGVALAVPLWQAAHQIREAEANWAMRSLEEFEDTGLEMFNNPDHEHVVQR